jgi:hypothetical protein
MYDRAAAAKPGSCICEPRSEYVERSESSDAPVPAALACPRLCPSGSGRAGTARHGLGSVVWAFAVLIDLLF